jgi:tetratricopeptide (TPR) repeat protein
MPEYVYVTTQNLVPYTRRATPHIAPLLNHPDFEKYYEFCFILKLPSIKLYKQMYRRRDLADPTFVIPSEQNRLLLRATTLYYIDHYAEACELLQAYIGKYPKDFLGYYDLGFCFAQQDKRAEALAAYRKSLEINPGHELSQRMIEALSPTPAAPKP